MSLTAPSFLPCPPPPEPCSLPLRFCGEVLEACHDGVLWWPRQRCLIVADLHLEKGSAFARRNTLLPPFDTAATLSRLATAMARLQPLWAIALGDSFHDRHGLAAMGAEDRAALLHLLALCPWVWIAGNHDPVPPELPVQPVAEWRQAGLVFRHEPLAGAEPGEIGGHYHPAASVVTRGGRLRGRCFVSDGSRMILPAFGAYTGGLSVRDPAIAGLMQAGFEAVLLGYGRPVRLPAARLCA